jgi:hypothetical protein
MLKKNIWPNFQRIIEIFTPKKLSQGSQKSGIWKKPIPDLGVKNRITDPDPQQRENAKKRCELLL